MAIGNLSADNDVAPYVLTRVRTRFSWKSGKKVLPVAGVPGTPAEVVQTAAGRGRKVVTFLLVRDRLPPEAPAVEADNALQVFLSGWVETTEPDIQADAENYRYQVRGRYTYALRLPVTPAEGFPCPSSPATSTPPSQNFYGPQFFVQDIIQTPTAPQVTLDAAGKTG